MKLLLDAMYTPEIARQLRRRGHDAVAAKEWSDRDSLGDADLFAAAQREQRSVVTNNIADFLPIDASYRERGLAHHGLILTTERRFSRSSPRHVGQLVTALDALLRAHAGSPEASSFIHWLH